MEQVEKKRYTIEEYNRLEEEQQQRYEYHDGEVFAMAGGDPKHSAIASYTGTLITNALGDRNCTPFNSDAKVYIDSANKFVYPDFSVVCGPVERSDKDKKGIQNPTLIVEVLSESTAIYDRGDKFRYYMQLPSLQEYILIEQDQQVIQTFFREGQNSWKMNLYDQPGAVVLIRSVQAEIPLESFYRFAYV
jgi:Uma2 family endonuclease